MQFESDYVYTWEFLKRQKLYYIGTGRSERGVSIPATLPRLASSATQANYGSLPLWKLDVSTKFHIFFSKFTFYRWHVALNTSRKVRKKTTNNLNELLCATIVHQVFILAIKNTAAEPWLYPDVCYSWRTDHAGRILLIKDACCVYQKYKQ